MEQRWRGARGCQQGISPSPAPKLSLCHPPREAQPRLFQGKGSGGWCQSEPWQGLCAAPASSCGIFTILTHLVSPGPQTGAAAQASRSQHPGPGESHAGSLQGNCSSLPQVLNFLFLATFGCCHSHPGPQLQGQTRRDKARAARSPAATTSNTGVLGQGKGQHPSLLFSQIRTWQVSDTWACKAAKAANPRPGLCALPPAHKQRQRAPRHSSPRHTATLSPKAQPQSHPCPVGSRRVDHRRVDHRRRGACSAWGLQSKTTSLEQG